MPPNVLFLKAPTATGASQAQLEAGNYRKKPITFQGLNISIENTKGSVRRGVDRTGKPWETKMHFDYGYIRGSMGVDKDHVDCYVGPNEEADTAYIVHQRKAGRWDQFDEDKVMLGFDSESAARAAYLQHYDDPRFLGPITAMQMEEFKEKLLATMDKPGMIKALLLILKGEQRNLFEQPVHVEGHMRDGVYVKPHTARRLKGADVPAETERPRRPDGRWIPREGDKVYQFVAGPFGMPAVVNGVVQRNRAGVLRVRCTGGASLIGQAPTGKTFPMSDAWNVDGDPEIERRKIARAEKEAAEKAAAEAARQAEDAERARLIAESKEAGFTHLDESLPPRGSPIENVVTGEKGVFHDGGEYPTAIWGGNDTGAVTFPLAPVRIIGEPSADTLALVNGYDAENARAIAELNAQLANEDAAKAFWDRALSVSQKVDFGTIQLGEEQYGLTVRRGAKFNSLEIWLCPAKGKAEKLPAYPLASDFPEHIKNYLEKEVLADGAVVVLADGMTMVEGSGMIKSMMLFFKARVRGHIRHTKDGKIVQVREHVDKRTKKPDVARLSQGDTVMYARSEAGEKNMRFRVLAVNGDRIQIQLLEHLEDESMRIKPIETVRLSDLRKVKAGGPKKEAAIDDYDRRVRAYEAQGMTRSDAQGVVDAEDLRKVKAGGPKIDQYGNLTKSTDPFLLLFMTGSR